METDFRSKSSGRILPINRQAAVAAASHYGDIIRLHRQALGWSLEDLCARAGVTFRLVVSAERGSGRVRWSTIEAIASALGLTAADLFLAAEQRTKISRVRKPAAQTGDPHATMNRVQRLVLQQPYLAKNLFRVIDRFLDYYEREGFQSR